MHAIALATRRTTTRSSTFVCTACRIAADLRADNGPSITRRTFRAVSARREAAKGDAGKKSESNGVANDVEEENVKQEEDAVHEEQGGKEDRTKQTTSASATSDGNGNGNGAEKSAANGSNGRTTRRRVQEREKKGVPELIFPEEFWKSNVMLLEDVEERVREYANKDFVKRPDWVEKTAYDMDVRETANSQQHHAKYYFKDSVYEELRNKLRNQLLLRPPDSTNISKIIRPTTVYRIPHAGGVGPLLMLVDALAYDLQADIVHLTAEDLARLLGSYIGENVAWQDSPVSEIAYEVSRLGSYGEHSRGRKNAETEDRLSAMGSTSRNPGSAILSLLDRLPTRSSKGMSNNSFDNDFESEEKWQVVEVPSSSKSSSSLSEAKKWSSVKLNSALERVVSSVDEKAARSRSEGSVDLQRKPRDKTIIHLTDFMELNASKTGRDLIGRLRSIVEKKWKEGRNIVLLGTTQNEFINEEEMPAYGLPPKPDLTHLWGDADVLVSDTLIPVVNMSTEYMVRVERARIGGINVTHIEEMLRSMISGTQLDMTIGVRDDIKAAREQCKQNKSSMLDTYSTWEHGLNKKVLSKSHVCNVASLMIGRCISSGSNRIGLSDFQKAVSSAAEVSTERFNYVGKFSVSPIEQFRESMGKVDKIIANCDAHERKLSSGIIQSSDIKTTFKDIRAPEETIEALKTLTSLSLLRPQAFSYGVLATDKIPGLLLYGPPGTGKTLLAKAVAKESGATVLEVSGADLNDKYLGESEKNAKALFSLAKKLSPCIVFIDEADAIFAARGGSGTRSDFHRGLINQFLREWDGMRDMGTFIMIATNRPFDLDDAVLRRLPRRLLVDLPIEKDREAILRIHLKDETLSPEVDIPAIAKDTPFYSGSDLKNVCVAAAMACIRDENAEAAKWTGEEKYVYPEKRTLKAEHFKKALEEISASVGEDMSTLTAIRKFDEKYGDRKGRKKKKAGMGFGVVEKGMVEGEDGRVRTVLA